MAEALIHLSTSNEIIVTIEGQRHTLDVKGATASVDIDEDMENIAGLIGWYTQVLAAAREHSDMIEAGYRAWQAEQLLEYIQDEPRLAEWKAKAALNAEPSFLSWKTRQAVAWKLVNRLSGAVKALEVKADMLRSRGAMMRTEINHLDRSLPGPRISTAESVGSREARLRARLKGD